MSDLTDLEARATTDPTAAMILAEHLLLGIDTRADQKAAYRMVQQAAKLGHPDGRRAWVYLTAAGIGRKADPKAARQMLGELAKEDKFAALQVAFLDHIGCEQRLAGIAPKIISQDPYMALYPQLFSPAECRYLAVLGTPWLEKGERARSGRAGADGRADPRRQACSIPNLAEDLIVQAINRCIATATGTQPGWGEPLNILKYAPGQQYRPHHDGTGSDNVSVREQTALIWLNDAFEGGGTDFPSNQGDGARRGRRHAGFPQHPRQWLEFDERMIHAGLPVTSGIKWMASRWIRSENYLK